MATRFRKHRTRKSKGRKGLKTRRHRGGNFLNNAKSKLTAVFNPTSLTKKVNNTFKMYTANAVGAAPESLQEFKNRMKGMTKKGGDMASFLSKGRALLNKVTPQSMKNKKAFLDYLTKLDDEVKYKLKHEDRVAMKSELLKQLKQDTAIAEERRKMLGEAAFHDIVTHINKIKNYINTNTNNNNNA